MPMQTETEKLHKVLARAGLGSRREIEKWIAAGRVSVDGRRAAIGDRVGPRAVITIDNRPVSLGRNTVTRVLAYHKPVGEICSRSDPGGRPDVFARLPHLSSGRWISVGRLDLNSSGLLLVTNDGELADRLMHPSSDLTREYMVRVSGEFGAAHLAQLRNGIKVDGQLLRFDDVERTANAGGSNSWYRVTLHTGRNREVRHLWNALGGRVSRLLRVRYGPVALPRDLAPGRYLELGDRDVAALRREAARPVS